MSLHGKCKWDLTEEKAEKTEDGVMGAMWPLVKEHLQWPEAGGGEQQILPRALGGGMVC